MTAALVDGEVRRRAIEEVEGSFALAAGAGAGKTQVLVDRLVRHLLSGQRPKQIAAITFTRATANELASRSRDALEEHLERAHQERDPATIQRLEEVLGEFHELTLATIHSFCQELLRQEALEARWAPDTEVASAQGAAAVSDLYEVWRSGFDARHPAWGLLLRRWATEFNPYGGGGATVRGLVETLLGNQDLAPIIADREEIDFAAAKAELAAAWSDIEAQRARCRNPTACKLYARTSPVMTALGRLLELGEEACLFAALEQGFPKVGNVGNSKDWEVADKKALQARVGELHGWQAVWKTRVGEQIHRCLLLDLREHYLPVVEATRLRLAQADFSDLLFRSRALLLQSAEARGRLSERYKVLLIDEVQDTDPIQAEVAALLTGAERGPWHQGRARPGSLFAVGDPKQSIYRFRRADIAVWGQLQALIARDGEALALSQNFRAVPGLVAWANHTFAELPDFQPQVAHRAPGEVDPVVLLQADSGDEEIDALVRHFKALKDAGAQVFDKEAGATRAVEDRDLLILIPAWTHAAAIQERMTLAGIECTVEGGRSFFDRDEIRLMLAAMRAIDEPQDSEATVCVLRGLFGISHQALAQHRADGGYWSSLSPAHPPGPVGDALRVLGRLHVERHRCSWVDLLDELLDHTGVAAVWALMTRRWSILANLDKLRTLIRTLEPRTRSSTEVVEALAEQQRTGAEDLSIVDEDNRAARVMTYFKAKGLEAPVVAIVCASRRASAVGRAIQRGEQADALAVAASGSVVPPGWAALKAAEKEENARERRRWMYVAATRARDQLVVVRGKSSKGLFAPDLERGLPDAGSITEQTHGALHEVGPGASVRGFLGRALPEVDYDDSTFPGLDAQVDALLAGDRLGGDPHGEARQRQHLEAVASSRRASSRWRSVGHLTMRKLIEFEGGGVGPRGGELVHRVMEHLELGEPDAALRAQVPELTRAFGVVLGLSEALVERCEQVSLRLLELPVIGEARRAPERWREVPFAFPDRGVVVTGRIDLCFPVNPGRTRWKVVDWKSHLPPLGSALHDIYRRQLAYYAKAVLETVTPCKHVDAILAGPHHGIGHADWLAEKLELVNPLLTELVQELATLGAEPEVGYEPEFREYVELELAWPDARVALGLNLTDKERALLEREGWRVAAVETLGTSWPQTAARRVFELLGLQRAEPEIHEEEG